MKRKAFSVMMAVFLLFGGILGGCSSSSEGTGTLRVGVRDDIMNFGYLNQTTGNYYGLEIDLARKLASELGYRAVELVAVEPDTRKDMLLNGEVDCLIACYSIAETRLENFDFSQPYYKDSIRVMVEKSSLIDDLEDLKDKKIGVLAGANTAILMGISMHEQGLLPEFDEASFNPITFDKGLSYLRVEHYSELDTVLEQGEVDAVCMDGSIAQGYMNEDRKLLDVSVAPQEYGVATQKDSALSQPVADAIQKLLDDGTIDALIDKWD